MTVLEPVIAALQEYGARTVTLEAIMELSGRPRRPVLRVMDRLTREGVLREVADLPQPRRAREPGPEKRNPVWAIQRKPVLTSGKPKRRTVRDRMWQVMRSLRRFTRADVQRLGQVGHSSAEDYTMLLVRGGYLREIGKDGHQKVFLLIKDCGPARPLVAADSGDRIPNRTAGSGPVPGITGATGRADHE